MTTQEILSQQTTKTRKMQQLLQLGFTRKQVAEMMGVGYGFVQNVYTAMQRNGQLAALSFTPGPFTRTFGIEIEAYGVTMAKLKTELERQGILVEIEGYNHTTRRHWKIVTDASLNGRNAFELVSPVLEGETGLEQVQKVCKALKRCNALINKTCGLHVHFGANDFELKQWKNLYKNYLNYEGLIDSFMPQSRRGDSNPYCKSLMHNFRTEADAFAAIDRCRSVEQISQKITGRSRYCKLNAESFFRHGTVEFRQHSGTIEVDKILNWVKFLNNFIGFSKNNVSAVKSLESLNSFNQTPIVNFFKNRITALAA
ncbi:MAG: amidoligase family protein [Hymenobacteraceae bacterium]|nr:amidoligase family protein [Hymenobacteraceae bacterium]MDX5396277.1 amidoligase family protein [Hymenobacteraceae bacterium]MDX5442981.1 amidoligase family protein [Hymenobacteraceae bacterium]MDX5512338.1 amidoligase family protein [Hymenobacteraceae bacterium]